MLKLLCAADLHIGRRPTRLPDSLSGRFSASVAWLDLVDRALADGVDAVLLAGDVVDQDNRYFEAYGPLERGVRQLKEAGIALVAVAGNHDHRTLHDVASEVGQDHMTVLGRGGEWERWTLQDDDGAAVLHVDGWSFPDSRYMDDPTERYALEASADGAPVVGLLHCDLDERESRYAPVTEASVRRLPASAWVLGHIHVPGLREAAGQAPLLYPGSLLALDPGETGRHGAWVLELEAGQAPKFRPLALSRVRYEPVHVDLGGVDDAGELRGRVAREIDRRLDQIVEEGAGALEVLCCRLRLTGRTPLHSRVASLLGNPHGWELNERNGVLPVPESRLSLETSPALDLDELARGSDAPALLAALLQRFEAAGSDAPEAAGSEADAAQSAESGAAGSDEGGSNGSSDAAGNRAIDPELLARTHRASSAIAARPHFAAVASAEGVDPTWIPTALRRQASRLLDELMRQKDPS